MPSTCRCCGCASGSSSDGVCPWIPTAWPPSPVEGWAASAAPDPFPFTHGRAAPAAPDTFVMTSFCCTVG
eukprot:11939267-Heterocapsa_arctica.AAC.1